MRKDDSEASALLRVPAGDYEFQQTLGQRHERTFRCVLFREAGLDRPGLSSRTLRPRYRVGLSKSHRCSSVASVWIARVGSVLVLSSSSCSLKS